MIKEGKRIVEEDDRKVANGRVIKKWVEMG